MLAESHPLSIHLSIHPSIPPPPLPRWRRVGSKDDPRVLTHTHVDTHLRDVSLPIPPASSRHSPLAAPSTYTCSFPSLFPSLSLSVFLSTPACPQPPPHAVCHRCREERKMLRPTKVKEKTQKRVKEEKIVKAGVCVKRSDASIHHEPDSSLMEYPGRRRAEGGRRGR